MLDFKLNFKQLYKEFFFDINFDLTIGLQSLHFSISLQMCKKNKVWLFFVL